MHVNVAYSTQLITLKMLAPCGLNLHFYIFCHGLCVKKNHKYKYQDKKNLNDCSIHMYTYQTS
jgi:hypothetical protein